MNLSRSALAFAVLLSLTATAGAEVWTDPSLAEALAGADLVVRAKAPKEGAQAQEAITFRVLGTLKGDAPATVSVGGLHDPTRSAGASFAPDAEVLLILQKKGDAYRVPTPTFGRYPIREGVVHYATLRDTYLRLALPLSDFAAFIALQLERPQAEWLAGLRAGLAKGSPSDRGDDLAQRYLALESLALVGGEEDKQSIVRYLDPSGPFQLRVSACRALARAMGSRAAGRLLKVAGEDAEPAVRTAAIGALGRLAPPPSGLVKRLAALLPSASGKTVRFSRPTDPRLNKWPSPKAAALRVITRHGAAPVKQEILRVVATDSEATAEVFTAALKALISLKGDPKLPAQLVRCFRAEGEVSSDVYNREICAALTLVTGERLGQDPTRWRRWIEKR